MPDFSHEQLCGSLPIGIDEAGRGPWAGPVVAAAVWLNPTHAWEGIHDSKQLSASARAAHCHMLLHSPHAIIGIGQATVQEIDTLNILQATFLAMQRAVDAWHHASHGQRATHALIDGNRVPKQFSLPATALVKGDSRSLSIAAASIVAKVTRDTTMQQLHAQFPHYGWDRNAGYGTAAHQQGLRTHGVNAHHRRSYAPIRALLHAAVESLAS